MATNSVGQVERGSVSLRIRAEAIGGAKLIWIGHSDDSDAVILAMRAADGSYELILMDAVREIIGGKWLNVSLDGCDRVLRPFQARPRKGHVDFSRDFGNPMLTGARGLQSTRSNGLGNAQ